MLKNMENITFYTMCILPHVFLFLSIHLVGPQRKPVVNLLNRKNNEIYVK